MTAEHEVTAALAERVAALVDDSARSGDGRTMLSAVKELRDLLDTLPIRATRIPGGGESGDDGSGGGGHLELLTSPPTVGVGNTPNS